MSYFDNITETIGRTPIVKLNNLATSKHAAVFAKIESFNPTSSVKDRIAVYMINDAEKSGKLKAGGVIIEPTSGNTGVGLAMVAAARRYKLIITMPDSMSVERIALLRHFGAEVVLTPAEMGMSGAIGKAKEIYSETPGAYMPQQFLNPANPEAHKQTTFREIWEDMNGDLDIFVCGVGTGGTLTGVGRELKKKNSKIKIVAVEPEFSPVLSGGRPGKHGIQGIGAGFVPEILDKKLIDEIVKVPDTDALKLSKKLATQEGIICGISSGAAIYAALKLAKLAKNRDKKILTILPDTGERYLSTNLFCLN